MLIDAGTDINKSFNGQTMLGYAVQSNNPKIVSFLLENGADTKEKKGAVLHLAAQTGNKKIVSMLLGAGAQANATDFYDRTPLHRAKNADVAEKLIIKGKANVNAVDWKGNTPLMEACRKGDYDTAKILLEANADPNICNQEKKASSPIIWSAVKHKNAKLTQLLLDYGANADQIEKYQTTARIWKMLEKAKEAKITATNALEQNSAKSDKTAQDKDLKETQGFTQHSEDFSQNASKKFASSSLISQLNENSNLPETHAADNEKHQPQRLTYGKTVPEQEDYTIFAEKGRQI